MRNLRLLLGYDGTDYIGWQVQPNGPSVQQAVEDAIHRLTGERTRLTAAGRTDSGVHAIGQVANFHSHSRIPANEVRRGLQNFLPPDIVVRRVDEVPTEFHATYDAVRKRYRYVIRNDRIRDPFTRRFAWHFWGDLDVPAMSAAAGLLVGRHDFRCFESQWPNKATSVRTIEECTVRRASGWGAWEDETAYATPGSFIVIDAVADGFLYNMVRAIVGTLIKVGRGTWPPSAVGEIVASGDRSRAGETAPALGLHLVRVDYAIDEQTTGGD